MSVEQPFTVNFKVSQDFAHALDIQAEWLGVSRSELIRTLITYAVNHMPEMISDEGWPDATPSRQNKRRR